MARQRRTITEPLWLRDAAESRREDCAAMGMNLLSKSLLE